jgi:hypothetical protein
MLRTIKAMVLLVIPFFWSCQHKTETEFPIKMNLTGEEIQVDAILALGGMVIHDSLLLKKRSHEAETAIRIFDLADFSLLSNAVSRGRGPGEVANPAGGVIDEENDIYWLTDWGKNCIHKFYIDSLLTGPGYKATSSFPIDKSWIPTMNMFYHPSGHIGFTSVMLQKNLISFMDLNGNLVDSMAIPNKIYPDVWKDGGFSDVPLICLYVPEKEWMLIVSRHENKFSVIEMDGTPVLQKEDIPEATDKIYAGYWENSFYSMHADDTYIFLVYTGGQMGEFDSGGNFQVKYPNRLLVVDWEGNFRYDITLDHRIIFVTLDKARKRLICDTDDFDNYLVSYNLSGLYIE